MLLFFQNRLCSPGRRSHRRRLRGPHPLAGRHLQRAQARIQGRGRGRHPKQGRLGICKFFKKQKCSSNVKPI